MSSEIIVSIVDDDFDLRESLSLLLRANGLKVITYPSAEKYLEEYDSGRHGCVIADMRMPGMSGLDLYNQISESTPHPPVIILTAYGEEIIAESAKLGVVVAIIEKPYKFENLLQSIHEAIEKDQTSRKNNVRQG